eukprot:Skav213504  [mRNA]  locus=scaffold3849:220391:247029:- [translate_table: standard]
MHAVPGPITTFQELNDLLPRYVLDALTWNNITNPLPIQCQALPLVLTGLDVIGIAQTGSGKTLAYLLPAIVHIVAQPPIARGSISPVALIMAPTRELAVQIVEEAHKAGLKSVGKKFQQLNDLEYGCDIVAATPGRLIDFMTQKKISLERVTYLVLDEADRMLEEGFAGDVESISSQVRPERQVLFFSATWSHEVQKLAAGLCNPGTHPVRISVGQDEHGSLSAKQRHARDGIVQTVQVVDFPDDYEKQVAEKRKLLEKYLQGRKQYADELATKLWDAGFKATAMHGGKSQDDARLRTLEDFRKGEYRLMVATDAQLMDVIGRGIDIPSVSHVIIFDMGSIDDYVHRIGRTARGKDGHGQDGLRNPSGLQGQREVGQSPQLERQELSGEAENGEEGSRDWTREHPKESREHSQERKGSGLDSHGLSCILDVFLGLFLMFLNSRRLAGAGDLKGGAAWRWSFFGGFDADFLDQLRPQAKQRLHDGWPVISVGVLLLMPVVFSEMMLCEAFFKDFGGHALYDGSLLLLTACYSVSIKMLVLDAADEMLNLGFKEQVYDIYRYLPPSTQVVLVSATMPHEVLEMTHKPLDWQAVPGQVGWLAGYGSGQCSWFFVAVEREQWKFDTLCDLYDTLTITQDLRGDLLQHQAEGRLVDDMPQKERDAIMQQPSGCSRGQVVMYGCGG